MLIVLKGQFQNITFSHFRAVPYHPLFEIRSYHPFHKELIFERCPWIFAKEINSNSESPRIVIQQVYASTREETIIVNISSRIQRQTTSIHWRNRRAMFCFNELTSRLLKEIGVAKNQICLYNLRVRTVQKKDK